MTLSDYTRLQDDGCPNCPDGVGEAFYFVADRTLIGWMTPLFGEDWRFISRIVRHL